MKRILVVDYEDSVRNITANLLNRIGYETLAASNSQEALSLLEKGIPDLILIDYLMGDGITGLEACRRIREVHTKEELPIVIMSGAGEALRRNSIEAGANDYLPKPYNLNELVKVLMKNLGEN
ncbi:MAG: response regulator [Nanoarchaeota archaeon]|nr:response regulator [Nanoarchaeota archaeon]